MSARRDSGNRSPEAVGTVIEPMPSHAAAHVLRQPHDQRKPQLPFDHFAQRLAADRFDDVGHHFGRHAVAGELLLIELDLQHGLAGDLFGGHVGRAGNLLQDGFDFLAFGRQHVQIVAVQFHRHVGADAGHHFVHPHFDRLQKLQPLARQVAQVAFRSASVSSAWVCAFFHWSRGLSVMNMSVSSMPIGSVAISAVPMRLQTCSTSSGNSANRAFSICVLYLIESSSRCRSAGRR